ncbi:MAG TPA: tetratricopeptide repeat protein [Candidatus Acidoferrales bacterium]|nr:tetratricopeptide repeat protein [Candidatus Acidoferrales bacterium]
MRAIERVASIILLFALYSVASSQVTSVTEQQDYSFAVGLYRDAQYDLALQQFKSFLKNYPTTRHAEEITFLSGECLFQKRMYDSALSEYQKILDDYPNSTYYVRSQLRVGEVWLQLGKFDRAEKILKEILSRENGQDLNGEAAYKLGQLFAGKEDYNNAVKYFELSYEGYKESGIADYAMYGSAWSFGKLGEFEKSKSRFAEMLSAYPNTKLKADAGEKMGECDFFLTDYKSAISEFAEAASLSSESQVIEPALYYEGRADEKIGRSDSAISGYSNYLNEFPSGEHSSEVRVLLSKLLVATPTRAREALRVLSGVPHGDPLYFESQLETARAYEKSGSSDTAEIVLVALTKSRRSSDEIAEAQYEMGKLYFKSRSYGKSAESFLLAAKDTSLYGEAMKNAAISSSAAGDYRDAKNYFANSILKLQGSDLLEAHFDYASALYASGDYKGAAQIFLAAQRLAASDSDRSEALYMAGESFYRAKDFKSSLSCYLDYSQIYSAGIHAGAAVLGVGYSNYFLGNFLAAAGAFQKFIAAYPNSLLSPEAFLRLGDCYYYGKDYEKALGVYKDAASRFSTESSGQDDSTAAYALYQSGESDYWLGKFDASIEMFRALLDKYPHSPLAPDAQYAIGWVYFSQKQYSQAIGEFDKVTANYPSSLTAIRALYSKGDSYYNSAEYQQALMCYSELLSKYPSSEFVGNALVGMQYCLTVLGKPKEAEKVIDNFVRDHPQLPNVDKIYYKKIEYALNEKQYPEAEHDLKEFIVKFPRSSLSGAALYNLALVEIDLGKTKAATGVLSDLIAKRPGDEYTTAGEVKLAELYSSEKGYSESEKLLTEASYAQDVYGVAAQVELGKFYLDRGDTSKAELILSKVTTADTSNDEERAKAKLMLSAVYFSKGRTVDAVSLASSVAKTHDDLIGAQAQLRVAEYYCGDGDSTNAVLSFLRVKYVFASFSDIVAKSQIEHADCLMKFGNKREARTLLQEFVRDRTEDSYTKLAREKLKQMRSE